VTVNAITCCSVIRRAGRSRQGRSRSRRPRRR
jgi:hypothetical protein